MNSIENIQWQVLIMMTHFCIYLITSRKIGIGKQTGRQKWIGDSILSSLSLDVPHRVVILKTPPLQLFHFFFLSRLLNNTQENIQFIVFWFV